MKSKSLFPSLLLFCLVLLGLSQLGKVIRSEATSVERLLDMEDLAGPEVIQRSSDLKQQTDTLLSNNFRLKNSIQRTEGFGLRVTKENHTLHARRIPIYDTILECYYRDRLLFKERSLKQMVANEDQTTEFWEHAGLEYFEVDMEASSNGVLFCTFGFRNTGAKKLRQFTLEITTTGESKITEV